MGGHMHALNKKQSNYLYLLLMGVMPLLVTPFFNEAFYSVKVVFTVTITAVFLIMTSYALSKTKLLKVDVIDLLLAVYLLFIIISFVFSINKTEGIVGLYGNPEGIVVLITYVAIFFIFKHSQGFDEYKLNAIAVSACIISAYGVLQYYDILPWIQSQGIDNLSTIGQRNFIGTYCTLLLPLFVWQYMHQAKRFHLMTAVLLFMFMICSTTRSSWLAFFIWFPLLLVLNMKDAVKKKRWIQILIIFLVTTVMMDLLSGFDFSQRLVTLVNELMDFSSDDAGTGRMFAWKRTMPLIDNRPLTGSGPDTFGDVLQKEGLTDVADRLLFQKAHNEYLQMVLTLGIPALMAYLALVGMVLARVYKKMKKTLWYTVLFCVIIGYLIQAFFNISVISTAPIYWAFLGIGAQQG